VSATSPRVLGIVEGDPATAMSWVAHHLFDALARRLPVVDRVDYAPRGALRLATMAATVRPSRSAWRARFHTSRLAHRALSATLARRLAAVDEPFDLTLQLFGWVGGQPCPYTLYVDQTRLMAERGWPEWMPLGRRERSEILALERTMYAGASHLFTMGEAGRDSLIDDYGVASVDVSVAGGGVNFDVLPDPVGPAAAPTILFVGRDFERKGGERLLEAFEQVRRELPDAELHIAGVKRRFDAPGVVSHGILAGREELAELYRRTRVFCLPSLYEPWGLVLAEAMAHGLPCVGSDRQEIPQILGHGEAGLVVDPEQPDALAAALLRVLRDEPLAQRLGRAARTRVEAELNWDRVADRMVPILSRAQRAGP
jgi:glycosyltransferase involved in cell wall biosynthesis